MGFVIGLISIICPFLAIPMIMYYFAKNKSAIICSFLFGLAASAALYGYVADARNDIYRHISNLRYYVNLPLWEAFDAGPLKFVYVWDLWQWIISKLNNVFLMQASAAFVGYTIISYMIFDYAKLKKLSMSSMIIGLAGICMILSPLGIAVGIRNGNAFAICALAFYLYFERNGSYLRSLLIIALAVLLHHSIVILLVIWALYPLFRKKPVIGMTLMLVAMFTFTNYESYISVLMNGGSTYESLGYEFQKSVRAYTGFSVNNFHNSFTVLLQTVIALLLFLRCDGQKVFSVFTRKKNKRNNRSIIELIAIILAATIAMTMLLSYNGNRYFGIIYMMSIIPFMKKIEEKRFLRIKRLFLVDALLFITAAGELLLNLHNMNWGTGSLGSFVLSIFTGYLSRGV